jgi:hypothetical protein
MTTEIGETPRDDADLRQQSIAELLKRLAAESNTLIQQEIELAKAELVGKFELLRLEFNEKKTIASEMSEIARRSRDELKVSGVRAVSGVAAFGAAGLVAVLGAAVLTACFVLALGRAMPDWAAALIVGLVYLVIVGVFAVAARDRLRRVAALVSRGTLERLRTSARALVTPSDAARQAVSRMPEQTIETLKEDVEWIKDPTRSAAR